MQADDSERNRSVVRSLIDDVINGGQLERLDALVAEDYLDADGLDRDAYRAQIEATRRAFPDLRMTIEDEVASGDAVVVRLLWRATHEGEFLGIAPTGRAVEMTGIGILRLRDGKVVGRWNESDVLGLLQQLGAVPETFG